MNSRIVSILAVAWLALSGAGHRCAAQTGEESFETFRQLLAQIAPASPDPCESPSVANDGALKIEAALFNQAAKIVAESLNATPDGKFSPQDRAAEQMKKLEAISNQINAAWPDEERFHAKLIDLKPLLVVKMTFGAQARFFALGVTQATSDGKPSKQVWQQVGSDDIEFQHAAPRSWLDIYPLHRGPSGRARFLVAIGFTGCAGSSGIVYKAYEWDPIDRFGLDEMINLGGAVGMDEVFDGHRPTAKDPFAPIGTLRTTGSAITLPYCWFSAVDYWDNPSLCAVDTYDLSGDHIRFQSRSYNRPELVPIAKVLEFGREHDYPSMLGYCASNSVAQRILHQVPEMDFAEDPRVTSIGNGKKRIEFGEAPGTQFTVEKHADRWVIASFKTQ
jgi:hypothetical protein